METDTAGYRAYGRNYIVGGGNRRCDNGAGKCSRNHAQKNCAAQRGRDAGEKRTHATDVHPLSPAVLSVAISQAAQSRTVDEGGKAPVSPCEPLCAIFRRKPSWVPAFTRESKRGPFVREVEKRDEKRFGTAL